MRLWTSPTTDACVTAMLVTTSIGLGVVDPRIERMVEWLLGQQMDDGGLKDVSSLLRVEPNLL